MSDRLLRREREGSISTCYRCCGLLPPVTYLPCVSSGFIPGIFILHGGVYLTDCELFVRTAQDSTPEDHGEGMGWSPICITQAVQARWAMRMLLMLCGATLMSKARSTRNTDVGLTGYLRLRIVVRIDGGGLVVAFTPKRDSRSTPRT